MVFFAIAMDSSRGTPAEVNEESVLENDAKEFFVIKSPTIGSLSRNLSLADITLGIAER